MSDQIDELIQDILGNGIMDPVGSPEFTRKIKEAQKRRDTLFERQEKDKPNYGYSPENPIMTSSVKDSAEYLGRLRTADEQSLTWDRLGSVSLASLYGVQGVIVDEYQLLLNGDKFRKIYICPYGRSGDYAPRGMYLAEHAPEVVETLAADRGADEEESARKGALIGVTPAVVSEEAAPSENVKSVGHFDDQPEPAPNDVLPDDTVDEELPVPLVEQLEEKKPEFSVELIECMNCHTWIRKEAQFCRKCGAYNPLGEVKNYFGFLDKSRQFEQKEPKEKHTTRNVLITLLVIAAIGGLIYFLVTNVIPDASKYGYIGNSSPTKETGTASEKNKTETTAKTDKSAPQPSNHKYQFGGCSVKDLEVGQTVVFGNYEQDNDRTSYEPLEWVVIKKYDDRSCIELITKNVIDVAQYGETNQQWSSSNIRSWLNTFFNYSFSADEQKYVLPTDIKGADGEKISTDKVFLLAKDSIDSLLPKDSANRLGRATKYVMSKSGITISEDGVCKWMTRDPDAVIGISGDVRASYPTQVAGIRPAMYIRIDEKTPIAIE